LLNSVLTLLFISLFELCVYKPLIGRQVLVQVLTGVFLYVNILMIFTFFKKEAFRTDTRYILFAHMLLVDSSLLATTDLALLLIYFQCIMPYIACMVLNLLMIWLEFCTPLTLVAMCLERYVAICKPLRYDAISTPRTRLIVIVVIWLLSSVNFLIEIFFSAVSDPYFLTGHVYCTREQLFVAKWQYDMCQGFNSFFFVTVGITIIYTYGGIMVAARSIKAQKASRTVLLHLIQLGLCLTSFLYGTIERALAVFSSSLFINLRYLNFLFILLLPRCLSPLIYGLRDESVRSVFFCYLRCTCLHPPPPRFLS
uniref:G-protein coupled receptors family 1 profile domain-containing protein n=1 Tax=Scleropages formosus TaxID=113540 RepID=A0A8C9T7C6_SCLFO